MRQVSQLTQPKEGTVMNKNTIYCMWNDTTGKVILKQTTWDKVKDISRTGVKKFKPTQGKLAAKFARTKQDMYDRKKNS